jgi:hypothetical protein
MLKQFKYSKNFFSHFFHDCPLHVQYLKTCKSLLINTWKKTEKGTEKLESQGREAKKIRRSGVYF